MIRSLPAKAARAWVNWSAVKLAFAGGGVAGFVTMAIAMAGGQATLTLIERLS